MSEQYTNLPIPKKLFSASVTFVAWLDARIGQIAGVSNPILNLIAAFFGTFPELFGASGSCKETTGSMTAGSNVLTVASDIGVGVGNAVFVEAAGNKGSGNDLIAWVSAKNGNQLTLVTTRGGSTPANALVTVSNTLAQPDDTDACRAAINSLFDPANGKYGGTVNFLFHYKVNKDFDAVTNAILNPPYLDETKELGTIYLRGLMNGGTVWNAKSKRNGAIISTILMGSGVRPSVFAAKAWESTNNDNYKNAFNTMAGYVENITFLAPDNHNLTVINLANFMRGWAINCNVEQQRHHSAIIGAGLAGKPAAGSCAIYLPQINNAARNGVKSCVVMGCDEGVRFSEHAVFDDFFPFLCNVAMVAERGYRPNHGWAGIEHCKTYLKFEGQNTVNLDFNLEHFGLGNNWYNNSAPTDVIDASNVGHGRIGYKFTVGNVGDSTFDRMGVTGCKNLKFENTFSPNLADNFSADSPTATRVLPAAPTYAADAVIIDEFETSGDWHNRTPDVATISNNKWAVVDSYGSTAENKLYTAQSGLSLGLIDTGKTNNRLYVKRDFASPGLILRAVDHLNYFFVGFGDYNSVEIYKVVNGSLGSPLSSDAIPTTVNLSVSISSDNIIRVYDEANNVIKSLNVGADYASATKVGLRTGAYGIFQRFQVV